MNKVDEGFFKDAYQKYRAKVLGILQKTWGMVVPAELLHSVEDWIRDYFVDKFDELDCAHAIHDNFRNRAMGESMKIDEALKTLHQAGLITEYTEPAESGEPAAMQNLLKLKKYYPDIHVEEQKLGWPHYKFTPNDKCSAYFVYYPFQKGVRLYIIHNGHDSYMTFNLSVLEESPAKLKRYINQCVWEAGAN
jgi:hypothetical protein